MLLILQVTMVVVEGWEQGQGNPEDEASSLLSCYATKLSSLSITKWMRLTAYKQHYTLEA